jgi:hypothetical protein
LCVFTGCKRTYQESQLIGSWQLDVHVADARVTYYVNHNWVVTLISSNDNVPSGSEFGEWKLEGDNLITVTRSTFDNAATNVRETAKILKLNDSVLSEKTQDNSGKTKTSTFHKIDAPAASVSDIELAQKLIGTWRYSYTNTDKLTGMLLYSLYKSDGSASWRGTLFKEDRSLPAPPASGVWRFENGDLITTITNVQTDSSAINKESSDGIILVTESQFTYRDGQGIVKKEIRVQ